MLMGLLRMRLKSGGSFGLGGVLWNQVQWLAMILSKLTDVKFFLSGSHLALACHCRRGSFNSTPVYSFILILSAYRYFSSQVLMILNLNRRFLLSSIHQKMGVDQTLFP